MTADVSDLLFGVNVVPVADAIDEIRRVAVRADVLGLDLLGVQDHPYQRRFLETWALIGDLLARTERLRVFPDVANLPLRLPALIAKQAASLDLLSGGRFELGLGAGVFWEAIGAMGGPVRSAGDAVGALEGGDPHHPELLERRAHHPLRGASLSRCGPASGTTAHALDRALDRRL